ncbi:protein SYS1, putative [Plasmodium relictum]|uniref:Protein SYS1, putative n=1 Tax=Plasmodium relictum TaxID=85471 RepID=A0A1J1HBX6_PLARL|nr:protein SYS1, putative [Plasmodium relictum]CRH00924.1 protein SYS1, putative [Plasmodium relictum]
MKILTYFRQDSGRFILNNQKNNVQFIIWQILCLQSLYYTISSAIVFIFFTFINFSRNISYIFSTKSYFNGDDALFYMFFINILNSVIMSYPIKLIVKRAKKCLDYVLTYNIIHFILSVLVSGFPLSCMWYINFFFNITLTVLISEYICYKEEMKEIKINNIKI